MPNIWTPHLTVAAIIEQQGKFLMVEESPAGQPVLNQPAGHVEEHESTIDAVIREVAEETCRHFEPHSLCGIYRWRNPENGITYLRLAYCGRATAADPRLARDSVIISDHWLSKTEIAQRTLRSPLVLQCIEDYLVGKRLPLDLITELT